MLPFAPLDAAFEVTAVSAAKLTAPSADSKFIAVFRSIDGKGRQGAHFSVCELATIVPVCFPTSGSPV